MCRTTNGETNITLASSLTTGAGAKWNTGLWVAQVALAALYGMAAYMKLLMPTEALVQMGLVRVEGAPLWRVRGIGLAELAGLIGLILPAATRIRPEPTTLAALGLLIIQVLAIGFHLIRGEASVLGFNALNLTLCVFALWGRSRKSPVLARA